MPNARAVATLLLASLAWQALAGPPLLPASSTGHGSASAFRSQPPVIDIVRATADANHDTVPDMKGRRVRVRGSVVVAPSVFRDHGLQAVIDDGTGGIGLFDPSLDVPLAPGDRIEATGEINQYKGAIQLEHLTITRFGRGSLPAAIPVTGSQANGWARMNRRVHLQGIAGTLTVDSFGLLQLTADDGTPVTLFVPQPLTGKMDWQRYARGTRLDVTGVLSIHKPGWPYDAGFQIIVTRPTDVTVLSPPHPAWAPWLLRIVVLLAMVAVSGLLGRRAWRTRRQARERELEALSALSDAFAHAELTEAQLARHACDILTGLGVVDAAIVHGFDDRGCLGQLAASAADPAVGDALHCESGIEGAAGELSPQQRIQARVVEHGLTLLAVHPLATAAGTRGFLTALSPRHQRSSAMQERTLLAAAKLLAMAMENCKNQQRARVEQQALQQQVVTDELTGLYNRRFLDEYLRVQMPLAERNGGGLAFLTLDIDRFKQINDTYGHAVGDRVLMGVAALIRAAARGSDLPVRIGGEEFLVVVAKQDAAGVMTFAERLRATVQAHAFEGVADGHDIRVTVSVGVSLFGLHGSSAAALLHASDQAMYASKHGGRNRVSMAPPTRPALHAVQTVALP